MLRPDMKCIRSTILLVVISALVGIAGLLKPLDLSLETMRNKAQLKPVSGDIVVVEIDAASIDALGSWPWDASDVTDLTSTVFESGADRVFFNMVFKGDQESEAFTSLLSQHPGQVYLGAYNSSNRQNDGETYLPPDGMAAASELVVISRNFEFWNGIRLVFPTQVLGDRQAPTFEAALSGVTEDQLRPFPVDYSFDIRSIPRFSAVDILNGDVSASQLAGKDVVIGLTSGDRVPQYATLGQGFKNSTYIAVIGAETLRQQPVVLGAFPFWLIACVAAIVMLNAKRGRTGLVAALVAYPTTFGGPLLLASFGVMTTNGLALSILIFASLRAAWKRFGQRQKQSGAVNPISGLRTLNAMRHEDGTDARPVIMARVRRYSDIVATLPPDAECQLVSDITARLSLGAMDAELFHGEDGNFCWMPTSQDFQVLTEQMEAMTVIFRAPVRVNKQTFDVDVSFGVDQQVDAPISHRAASALAAAREAEAESTCWKLHDPAEISRKSWQLSLLSELDQAIVSGHVWVAFQPKACMKTGNTVGAEALVRWSHPERGPISPAEFVEAAEKHNRIEGLTAFVLDAALRLASEILTYDPDYTMSVNISPSLLANTGIIDMVADALQRHNVPAANLILEVTETMEIVQSELPTQLMNALKDMGVGLSIDDYGTGLSTLEYLRRIPATELKIDRSFTANICDNTQDQTVMKSTIQLAHALGMKCVAEGIETGEALACLANMGCDQGQGYYLSKPLPADDFLALVAPQETLSALYG